ncbi:LamG domain-containing protein [Kitasatospora sp. NPDC002227]|uniref:LamG domain-containing protein n=1 Tax=Kitasatospora sp. NPDC002227 TaxID=3154773 RepID=UPI0033190F18
MSGGWGGPGSPSGIPGGEPDWAAMAEANEREGRRKRLLRIGGGAAGALALGGILAAAVVAQHSGTAKPAATAAAPAAAPATAPSATAASPSPSGSPSASGSAAPHAAGLHLGNAVQVGPVNGRTGPALTVAADHEGYAEVKNAVINTAASFTVSAVVLNNAGGDTKAAVSQGSDGFFSLYLGREDSSATTRNRWVFKVQTAAATGKSVMALSPGPATTGKWTTLTGVYDAKAATVSLYVDGALAQTVHAPGIFTTGGPIEIGRARYKSHWVDFWNGSISEVAIWPTALPADQIAHLNTAPKPQASWLHP